MRTSSTKWILFVWLFWLVTISLPQPFFGEQPSTFIIQPGSHANDFGDINEDTTLFTSEETNFLASHPTIRVGIMDKWPPMDFVADGKPQGIGMDYLHALNRRLDHIFSVEANDFDVNLQKVKEKQLDIIFDVTPKEERKEFLRFTRPYLSIPHVLVARKKTTPYLRNEHDLAGKIIALEKGFYNVTYFQTQFPDVKIMQFDSTGDALDAVSRGVADAYAGNRAVATYEIESGLFNNLQVYGRLQKPPVELTIGVRNDWPQLASLLDRLLTQISREERRHIQQRWGNVETNNATVSLTVEEKDWLSRNQILLVGYDVDWAPIEYVNENGTLEGLSIDYLRRIETLLGVTFRTVPPKPWDEMMSDARHQRLDIITAITNTAEREQFLDFTEPYLSFPMVILTKEDVTFIGDMTQLQGKKVGAVSSYASEEMLHKNYPDIQVVAAKDIRAGLMDVVEGKTYAFVGSLASISWVIAEEGLAGLKVSGETPFTFDLCIGVKKNSPLLKSSLQKALNAIRMEDKAKIYRKWFNITYQHERDYSLMWKIILATLLLIGLFIFWNRRLSTEVKRRMRIELALKEAKEHAESADRLKSAFLATMSHELRTPLNSIIGFTGILLKELAGPLNTEQHKQLTIVRNAGRHLLSLINDVLDISKIEAGQLELIREPFSMDESISEVLSTITPLAEEKQIELILQKETELGTVIGDQRRMNQVLLNLLNNAVKFTDEGSVTLTAKKNDFHISVKISDTGTGIKQEDKEKLFRPFQQIDTGINRKHEGTGLGLSICHRLIQLWNGTICVESEWLKGSTFIFTHPLTTHRTSAQPGGEQ